MPRHFKSLVKAGTLTKGEAAVLKRKEKQARKSLRKGTKK